MTPATNHHEIPDGPSVATQPRAYFGPRMEATQGDVQRKAYLAVLVEYLAKVSGLTRIDILEVGSWAGASAVTWARAIKDLGLTGSVLCVDIWRPYFDLTINRASVYRTMTRVAESQDIFRLFQNNIAACGVEDIVDHIVGESAAVLPTLETDAFHIVFIDGSHRYADVRTDIANAIRLVGDGGILCGDDLELSLTEVDADAHNSALATEIDFVADPRTGVSYHPGVTQAVGETFPNASRWVGLWGVRRSGDAWIDIDLSGFTPRVPSHLASVGAPRADPGLRTSTPVLLETHRGMNIIAYKDEVFALRASLGAVDASAGADALIDRFGADSVIVGETAGVVRACIDILALRAEVEVLRSNLSDSLDRLMALEKVRTDPAEPQLLESYRGVNIIAYHGRCIGLRQSLGVIDFTTGPDVLRARHGDEDIIIGETTDSVKARIDAIELRSSLDDQTRTVRALQETCKALSARADGHDHSTVDLSRGVSDLVAAVRAVDVRLTTIETSVLRWLLPRRT